MGNESRRVISVDVFRGLTMLVMIFVNDVASVKGLPWWTYHMPGNQNGMTYVDMVFPAFLFVLGMSLPLSLDRRLDQGQSRLSVWLHVLLRSLSLVALGVFIANLGKLSPQLSGIGRTAWALIGFVGALLLWNVYPAGAKRWSAALKIAGFAMLFGMLAIFRRNTPAGAAWLDFSYWEILGLIGRAYLAVAILYLPFRKKPWAPAMWLAILVAANVASRMGWLDALHRLPYALWPFDRGELPSVAMAGVVAAAIFLGKRIAPTLREKVLWGLGYAALLLIAGWALMPFGISKNRATPSWCLFSAGASVLLFLALYWLLDIKGKTAWAAFVKPAGSNTLLTYILPDIFYAGLGAWYFHAAPSYGWPGVARSVLFTASILGVSALLTRWKIRMQL